MAPPAAAHVVIFGELSPKSKVHYTRFLLDHDVKFVKRGSDGKFVANIRLHGARTGSLDRTLETAVETDSKQEVPAIAEAAEQQPAAVESDPCLPPDLRRFASLIALIGGRTAPSGNNSGRVFVKETRLVRLMNDIYDARYSDAFSADNCATSAAAASSTRGETTSGAPNAFSRFIKYYFTNRFGLKKLVEQQAWGLIDGLRSLQHRVDVELFSSFLEGRYSEATLLFTLFARATIQETLSLAAYRPTLSKSARRNDRKPRKSEAGATIPVWLSKQQVESLAQTVFGSKTEDAFLEYMYAMKAFVQNQSPGRTASRLVEASELLFIAAETYEKSSAASRDRIPSVGFNSESVEGFTSGIELFDGEIVNDACWREVRDEEDRLARSFEQHPTATATNARLYSAPSHYQHTGAKAGSRVEDWRTTKESAVSSSSTATPVAEGHDVQQRLGSLLERMKKRQQQTESE